MKKQPTIDRDERLLKFIGHVFRLARESLRYSYRELAEVSGVSGSHILRMESGEYEYSVIKFLRVSEALGLSFGIVLESATFRAASPRKQLLSADYSKLRTDLLRWGSKPETLVDDERCLRGVAQSIAEAVAALILSSNPTFLVCYIDFPFDPIMERLVEFTERRLAGMEKHYERAVALRALMEDPYSKLVEFGILNRDNSQRYLESVRGTAAEFGWPVEISWLGTLLSPASKPRKARKAR